MSDTLPIYETFYAWQGEGCHMGRAAFFVRTFGCPVKCPWCDSAGTWHPDYVPESIDRLTPGDITARFRASHADFVVVTGGEPTIHDLGPLCDALHQAGTRIHLETSGSFPIRGEVDWVTVSPKWWKLPLVENLERADEIKIIVEDSESIGKWWEKIGNSINSKPVWLHPEWSQRTNPDVLNSISSWVKRYGAPFRAGFQIHRLFNVDTLDSGSRPTVPLGGNHSLGF